MFSFIADYLTRRAVAASNQRVPGRFLSWNSVQKIALLIDEPEISNADIDKFIAATGKQTEVYYTGLKSAQPGFSDWRCITRKEMNLLSLPDKKILNELSGKKFDVVISVSGKNARFNTRLAAQIDASYRCGNQNLFGELDLIIERNGLNTADYLKEVVKYLQMLRVK